jgi:hypothetical protein
VYLITAKVRSSLKITGLTGIHTYVQLHLYYIEVNKCIHMSINVINMHI